MPGKLSYFGLGGRGEAIRALCAHANIDYENNVVESNQEMKESGYSPMGGLPVWEEDGFVVCQGNSIMRYIGMRHGYYSEDPQTCFNIDSLMDFAEDVILKCNFYIFALKNGKEGEELATKRESFMQFWDKHIQVLGDRLKASGKPFIGGTDRPSIADIKCFAQPSFIFPDISSGTLVPEADLAEVQAKIDACPEYKAWIDRMK